jgi:glycosyltransferase involved in cell wall biosynthesis
LTDGPQPAAAVRVLHIGKFYPPVAGGIESALAELGRAQAALGAQVAALVHARPGERRSRSRDDGALVVREVGCWGQWLYAPVSPAFPRELALAIERFAPDVLHIHVPNTSAFFALMTPAARRVPWVVHWHADIPLDGGSRALRLAYPLYRPWESALLRRARAIIATSAPYRDASAPLVPWRDKTQVIPLGLAPDPTPAPRRREHSPLWPRDHLRVLAVGRLSHYKGFEILLDALRHLPRVSLHLIGNGERAAALRAQVRTDGLADRVQLAGHVDDATLRQAYADADVFCLPSLDRAEAFGMVLLEAMRAGLPAVASAIPGSGVGYVVDDGSTGLLVPPGDEQALATALGRYADDPALRKHHGDAGRARWRATFTPDRAAQASLDLYRSIASDRAAAARTD